MIKIVIADEHCLVRSGIKNILQQSGFADVIGEVGDGIAAVELAEKKSLTFS